MASASALAPGQAQQDGAAQVAVSSEAPDGEAGTLRHCVITGRRAQAADIVRSMLEKEGVEPMAVINDHLIPALDEVGERFEKGTFFLPQLMSSAEAAKAGFDVIKELASSASVADKGKVAVATVKGDIHDIGKNIVKMLLENYGYTVFRPGARRRSSGGG